MLSILFITPLWGFVALCIPFTPYEFSIGLAIMACVPTSLSSGVTLVIQGYGNGALGLLFTVATNVVGILTAPLMIKLVLGGSVNAKVNALDLLIKLGVSILMPLLVGKAVREAFKPVRDNICKYKAPLYLINNLQVKQGVGRWACGAGAPGVGRQGRACWVIRPNSTGAASAATCSQASRRNVQP